jgi:hypothetical protein
MKQLTLIILSTAFVFQLMAQKPLATFFTSGGEEFTVIMDGKKINEEPQSRVENVPLDNDWAKVKIVFKNEEILPIEKTIQGKDVDGNISSVTWEISENNKGKWVVKPSSWSKIEGSQAVKSNIVEEPVSEVQEVAASEETSTTTQTITTTYSEEPENTNVVVNTGANNVTMSVKVDDSGENADMNISMAVPGTIATQSQNQTQTTYTTITTTTTTTSTNNNVIQSNEEPDPLPGYNGRTGCSYPLSQERFETVTQSISSKDFEDSKLTVAKQVMKSNCLLASQVKEILMLFDFESTRLDFAKEAYSYTYDIDNYYILNDAFDFESSITELNEFISK